jgi:hypothetical protein
MTTKTASSRTEGLIALFDIQTDFLARALEGITEDEMHNRLGTKANHMAWIAGALVAQRYTMVSETHPEMKQATGELFENFKGIQDGVKYPAPEEYIKDWEKVSPAAREALMSLDDAKLDSELDMGGMKMTWNEMVTFTIYREASMIGQLALWRRLLGKPAMRYD